MKRTLSITALSCAMIACVPPTLWEVTPIGTSSSATPQYTFHTEVFGPLTYGGSCSSSTTYVEKRGDITITLNTLADGTYSDCSITITDAGILSAAPATLLMSEFTISGGGAQASNDFGTGKWGTMKFTAQP